MCMPCGYPDRVFHVLELADMEWQLALELATKGDFCER